MEQLNKKKSWIDVMKAEQEKINAEKESSTELNFDNIKHQSSEESKEWA